jgi:N-acetylglucosamine-6-sulfatase
MIADRTRTCWILLVALAFLAAAPAQGTKSVSRPNILFIFSDDHSIQPIGAYGGRLAEFCKQNKVTPNIDRLTEQGALFANSFCGNSLCSPSRASVLTGLHSHANGVMVLNKPIRDGLWTYPRAVREVGYETAVFGNWVPPPRYYR